jgi:bacillithiol biosynthesis deacetylase BshB1
MTESVDLLAVGAHPDDAEVGCGGVLASAALGGVRVAVADLTAGELATQGSPQTRRREARRAATILGLHERVALEIPDGWVGTEPGHREEAVALIRDLRPRVVLAPYTADRHPDHAAAGRLIREACFLASLGKFSSGSPHRPAALYHYTVHHPLVPSFVVDVTAVWSQKMDAVRAYRSQFEPAPHGGGTEIGSEGFLAFLEARSRFYGAMIGVEHGEAFFSQGPIALEALPGLHRVDADGPPRPPGYRAFA